MPEIEITYIDLKDKPASTWTTDILEQIKDITDDVVVFGLDDFFPLDYIDMDFYNEMIEEVRSTDIERYEMGWFACKKRYPNKIQNEYIPIKNHLKFGPGVPYSCSTQFSIWKTDSLKKSLSTPQNPWEYETQNKVKYAAGNLKSVFKWMESRGGLSGKQKGKINVMGLRHSDVDELIELGLLNKREIIYDWNGATSFKSAKIPVQFGEIYK